jgi:periplasmic divalent cation tolerance protein
MKNTSDTAIALVTAPNIVSARKIAKAILQLKLAACANLIPAVESHYWWEGKLTRSGEVLLVIKTVKRKLALVEKTVLANHPYDTPEFVAFPLTAGNERYLQWLTDSTAA